MRIEELREITTARLRTLETGATVRAAATALSGRDAGLVVVCGDAGAAAGVVSKSDLVRHLARAGSAEAAAAGLMTLGFVSCRPEDDVRAVWQSMTARGLQNVPVLGGMSRPP